jgi:hypothetical protein
MAGTNQPFKALLTALSIGASAFAAVAALSPPALAQSDEAAIREYIENGEKPTKYVRPAPDLDWENAFGVRYTSLAKRDAFYSAVVKPLQAGDTGGTLEVKVRFVEPTLAIADEYWREIGQRDVVTLKRGPIRSGRTTYVFQKTNGIWTEILERVADLRSPYYKHYTALPVPVHLAPATLAKFLGTYRTPSGHTIRFASAGDRFAVVFSRYPGSRVGIPRSATEVLIFDPNDLAEYERLTLSSGKAKLSDDAGDIVRPLQKLP